MSPLSFGQDLRQIISDETSLHLPEIIYALGEPCEVRLPVFPTETGVFANELQYESEINYADPVERKIMIIPFSDKLHASDEGLGGFIPVAEPLRGLITGEAPPERTMVTIRRSQPIHYYVIRREILSQNEPTVVSLYLAPVSIPSEVLGDGPYLPTEDELAEIAAQEADDDDGNIANLLAPPSA